MEFIDTHTHLFVSEFGEDIASVVRRSVEAGVKRLCLPSKSLSLRLWICAKLIPVSVFL